MLAYGLPLLGSSLVLCLAACDGSVTLREAPEGAGGGGGDDAGTGGDEPQYAGVGTISVWSYAYVTDGAPEANSFASATYTLSGTGSDGCARSEHGPCVLAHCYGGIEIDPEQVSAGPIQVAGGALPVTLTPSGTEYPGDQWAEPLFMGGETLVAQAAGNGDIPAHVLSVVAPSQVIVPEAPPTGLTIDRAASLPLSWTGGKAGDVLVSLTQSEYDGERIVGTFVLECRFPAAAGSSAIPAETLSLLPASSAEAVGFLGFSAVSSSTLEAGAYLVTLEAYRNAVTPSGTQGGTTAVLQ